VGGILANGTATISFTSSAPSVGNPVVCTYRGGSSTANPTDILDIEHGRTATLVSCTDGLPGATQRCGTNFSMNVQAPPGLPVSVSVQLDDQGCGALFELLTPYQTRLMHDSFAWPDPSIDPSKLPTVVETNPPMPGSPQPTPALYYAWVYVQSPADILTLRKLYVHMLSMPLFDQELAPFGGQCGMFSNPGDGQGQFFPVIMPGLVYNSILRAQNTQYQQQNHIMPGNPPFDAVILRNGDVPSGAALPNGSLNPVLLAQSNFHYLDYEPVPLPSQADMQLSASNIQAALQDALGWIFDAVQDIGKAVQQGIGAIDRAFSGSVTLNLTLYTGNINPQFGASTDPIVEAWGPGGGTPLGAGGLSVTVFEH
jgi:hypothetical protein